MEGIDFKLIKQWMAYGEITKIAKKHKISDTWASALLNNKSKNATAGNFDFILDCYEIAIERAAKFQSANERLKQLTEKL